MALAALMLVVVMAMVAFTVDIGYIGLTRAQLQRAADAAALAAVVELPDGTQVDAMAVQYANLNYTQDANVLDTSEVEPGVWDEDYQTFTPTANLDEANAVRVTLRRTTARGNPLNLFFAPVLGTQTADVTASAIALRPPGGTGTRFLIDDEMIDSDVPAIQALAAAQGTTADNLIRDNDGDWFIDLTPGTTLSLPTGQVGDEGLFDIMVNEGTSLPKFPFGPDTNPSHEDFLNYNEDSSSWRYDLMDTSDLDPLPGVGRWNDPARYHELVNPDFIHVSPVYKSDTSALDGVGEPVVNGVNALGLRRGLLAFKVVGVGVDPPGSVLPELIIEIVDPDEINLNEVEPGDGAGLPPVLVR